MQSQEMAGEAVGLGGGTEEGATERAGAFLELGVGGVGALMALIFVLVLFGVWRGYQIGYEDGVLEMQPLWVPPLEIVVPVEKPLGRVEV